jgi:mRNA-degrading endonuclease RelE of RelBE toxin-antitoxin system
MSYRIILRSHAERELDKLPPDVHGCLKMKGTQEWRIRIGSYRVRYLSDDSARTVTITSAGHRRESYDDL